MERCTRAPFFAALKRERCLIHYSEISALTAPKMHRRFLLLVLIACLCRGGAIYAAARSAASAAPQDPAFDHIDSIVQTLSEITGLPAKHPVPYGHMSKDELRHFLKKRIKKSIKPAEIRADELSLKMFGLVPPDFDLRQSTLDLLTEQAAAFYDYDTKKLFLLEGSSPEAETTTLAHELSHALADQYFHLDKFMESTSSNDDEDLARTAVVEGQASWLMMAYDLKQAGRAPAPTRQMLQAEEDADATSVGDYPVLKASPLYIRQSLLFPYSAGSVFFDAVYHKMGKAAFRYVFTNPPTDTAQIIHPDRYFQKIDSTDPDLPDVKLTHRKKEITSGDLGEFDHRILLQQYLGLATARHLSPHLLGANFAIVPAGKQHRPVLEYVSEWDTPSNAVAFFSDYKQVLRKKWKHCDSSLSTAHTFAGTGDNGLFVTHVSGKNVWSVEGLHNPGDWTQLENTAEARTMARLIPPTAKIRRSGGIH